MKSRNAKIGTAVALVLVLIGGVAAVVGLARGIGRTTVVGYFANSTGLYNGDDVVILGVPVGKVDALAERTLRLLTSGKLHADFSRNALHRATTEFTKERIVPLYESAYERALAAAEVVA